LIVSGLLSLFAVACTSTTSNSYPGAESGSTTSGGAVVRSSVASAGTSGAGEHSGAVASSGAVSAGSGAGFAAGAGSAGSAASGATVTAEDGGEADGGGSEGTADGGGDGGEADEESGGCTGRTYKLCEDFETGTVGGIPPGWTTLQGFASQRGGVGLANDQAHSGSMSLKSDSINKGQDRVQRSLAALGPTATKHWGRIFYKVGAPPPKPTTGVIHITFAGLEGTTENRVVDTVVATNGTHQWLFNIPDDSCCTGSSYDWSFDASWHCAEWNIDVAAESFHFYSDGSEVTQLAFTGRSGAKMSDYMSLGLGTIFYQTPPSAVVVWFDDLAIDDTQIGCL
jgi:hypothetical protein